MEIVSYIKETDIIKGLFIYDESITWIRQNCSEITPSEVLSPCLLKVFTGWKGLRVLEILRAKRR